MGERETQRKERIEAEGGGGSPLAGLSGAVRMMNGRPAQAVRALMGAAELYITLLSVCERLLKALKSPGSDTGARYQPPNFPKSAANDNVYRVKSSLSPGETKGWSGRSGTDVC